MQKKCFHILLTITFIAEEAPLAPAETEIGPVAIAEQHVFLPDGPICEEVGMTSVDKTKCLV